MSGKAKPTVKSALDFDPTSLSVGELCDLTDIAGEAATVELAKGVVSPKVLLGLAFILKRRTDPTYTIEQARQIRVVDLNFDGAATNGTAS